MMITEKFLRRNFPDGGYLISIFEHEERTEESRERELKKTLRFIDENFEAGTRFIWFRTIDAPDFVCASIFISRHPDTIRMLKKGIHTGEMEISAEKIPRLADYINRKAEGKFEMSANCFEVTRTLGSLYRNMIRLYRILLRKLQGAGKKNLRKDP